MVIESGAAALSVKLWLAFVRTGVTPLVAATVMVRGVNSFATVPLSTPEGESVKPAGKVPEVTAKAGAGRPTALKVWV